MLNPHNPLNSDPISNFNPFKNKKEERFEITEWIDFFGERYGWSMEETLSLPIPTFFALKETIEERLKKEKKVMEKRR